MSNRKNQDYGFNDNYRIPHTRRSNNNNLINWLLHPHPRGICKKTESGLPVFVATQTPQWVPVFFCFCFLEGFFFILETLFSSRVLVSSSDSFFLESFTDGMVMMLKNSDLSFWLPSLPFIYIYIYIYISFEEYSILLFLFFPFEQFLLLFLFFLLKLFFFTFWMYRKLCIYKTRKDTSPFLIYLYIHFLFFFFRSLS